MSGIRLLDPAAVGTLRRLAQPTVLLVASIVVCAGCIQYVPVELDEIPIGTEVRTRLSRSVAEDLLESLGGQAAIFQGLTVEGTLVEKGVDTVVLAAERVGLTDPYMEKQLRQRILLAPRDIVAVDRKRIDRIRTTGLVAVIGAAVAAIAIDAFSGESGGSRRILDDTPAEVVAPGSMLRVLEALRAR